MRDSMQHMEKYCLCLFFSAPTNVCSLFYIRDISEDVLGVHGNTHHKAGFTHERAVKLSTTDLVVLREILLTCQLKGLKRKPGVAYIFGLRGLVHLFYQTHFLCPPQKFICTGLNHIRLCCSALALKQELLKLAGEVFD